MTNSAHEITSAFAQRDLTLSSTLSDMLDEHFAHHTERRGCGFTQATRFLSSYINQTRDPLGTDDLSIFENWSQREAAHVAQQLHGAGWNDGWRALDEAPQLLVDALTPSDMLKRLRDLPLKVRDVHDHLKYAESRLFVRMLEHTLTGRAPLAPDIPGMPIKPEIGSCSQAEEFFLEIAHGRVRRHGSVNIIVGEDGTPLLIEKMNLGESHSAVVIAPIRICGVLIPVGSLCALKYQDGNDAGIRTPHGQALPLSAIEQVRFLRLTTLAIPPEIRRRAFSVQVEAQIRSDFFSPLLTTITQLQQFAANELAAPA